MALASCHAYDTYNFGVAHQFLANLHTPDVSQQSTSYPSHLILKLLQFMFSNSEKLSKS
jgi:hypothetical protein